MEDPGPSSTVTGPSQFWCLTQRRWCRKAGSANIFRGVNLQCLQRLFHRSGDEDADQRALLVWGHSDEADLAQALRGLQACRHRSRSRIRVKRAHSTIGPKWLGAFSHLRINEGVLFGPQEKEEEEEEDNKGECSSCSASDRDLQASGKIQGTTLAADGLSGPKPLKSRASVSIWHKTGNTSQGDERNPEHYLHRILH